MRILAKFSGKLSITSVSRVYTRTVTLAGPEGTTFRGFFVQSRLQSDQTTTVGVFSLTDAENSVLRPCTTANVSIMKPQPEPCLLKGHLLFLFTVPSSRSSVYF